MEYAGKGNLYDFFEKNENFSEGQTAKVFLILKINKIFK